MRRTFLLAAAFSAVTMLGLDPAMAAFASVTGSGSSRTPAQGDRTGTDRPAVATGSTYVEMQDVSYGSGPSEVLDAYLPEGGGTDRPAVVLIHGGGWESGSRADLTQEAQDIARAGMVAVNIDYPLDSPGQPGFPTQLQAAEAAVAWTRSEAAVLGVDPSRIGALGVSAGGNLALELGAADQVVAAVSWSAPTELSAFESHPYQRCTTAACGPLSMPYAVYRYLGCMPEDCPAGYAAASPETHLAGTHASYMVWNSSDELIPRSQADLFVAAAQRAGLTAEEEIVPGDGHATQYMDQAMNPSIVFLQDHLA